MNTCLLRVLGDGFDPTEFLAGSDLSPYVVFKKGEIPSNRLKTTKTGGFGCEVSSGSFENQAEGAIAFLIQYKNDLIRLSKITTIESCYLDFSYGCRLNNSTVVVQVDYLPAELLLLAGELNIGICLSLSNAEDCTGE